MFDSRSRSQLSWLSSMISSLPAQRVKSLQTFWEVSRESLLQGHSGALAPRGWRPAEILAWLMGCPWAAMGVVQKVTPVQRTILKAVAAADQDYLNVTQLQQMVPRTEQIQSVLDPLLESLVIVPHVGYYFYPMRIWKPGDALPGTTRIGFPDGTEPALQLSLRLWEDNQGGWKPRPLREMLEWVRPSDLAASLQNTPGSYLLAGSATQDLMATLLTEPDVIKTYLRSLSSRARRIFEEVARAPGPVPIEKLLPSPTGTVNELIPVLMELLQYGLVFPTFEDGKRACYVDARISEASQGKATPLPAIRDEMLPVSQPAAALSTGSNLLWNLMVVGLWIRKGDATVTISTGTVPKRAAKQMLKAMARTHFVDVEDEAVHVGMLINIMGGMGLVRRDQQRLVLLEKWKSWTESSALYQTTQVLSTWLISGSFLENFSTSMMPGRPLGHLLAVTRQKVWKWLQELEPNQWYSIESLSHRMLAREPHLLRSAEMLKKPLGAAATRYLHESWDSIEGQFLRECLFSGLLEAGVLDAGWDNQAATSENPQYFRITDVGRELMEKVDILLDAAKGIKLTLNGASPPPGQPLVVQPNLEVLLLEMDPRVAYAIGEFAEPLRYDRIGTFSITAERVKTAVGRRLNAEQMIKALQDHSKQPLPQNVEYQIKDWAGSVRTIHFERATVVEVGTPEDLDTLLLTKPMRTRLKRRLSPTAALISVGEDVKGLAKQLEAVGFMWNPPADWETDEEAAYTSIHRTLKRFEKDRYY